MAEDPPEELHEIANPAAGRLVPIVKAHFVGENSGVQSTLLVEREAVGSIFGNAGALMPAYDPHVLALIFENSSALRPNVDAYVANIDSFGHAYVPTIELTAADADEKIRDALRVERALKKRDGRYAMDSEVFTAAEEPSDEEVKKRKKQLEIEIRTERALLGAFFENCTTDMPFSGPEGLRGLTRQDIEVIGSGYWEVLRNGLGQVCQFNHIPAVSMRMMPADGAVTEVEIDRRISLLSTDKVKVRKRFRRYIQTRNGTTFGSDVVYFKEFGDPRVISAKTGKVYESEDVMRKDREEEGAAVATEVIAFKISSPRSPYGVPRWIGSLLAVMGTRQAEEVNFLYFENRSVPPLAILVSGGRLNEGTIKRLEDYIQTELRGKRNFHKIMILEAEGTDTPAGGQPTSHMKIELRPLTDAQQKDATFQAYDERNEAKVGQAFRLPPILRGNIKDFNRSTAAASIDFAEIQVFGPIRQQFDWVMNKLLFPALGAKYHTFKSNAPTVRDPEQLARMIALIHGANITTGDEARDLSQDVFNRAFDNLSEEWSKKPFAIALAEVNAQGKDGNVDFEEAGGMSAGNAGQSQRQAGVRQAPSKTTPPDREKPKPKSNDSVRAMAKASMMLQKTLLDAERAELDNEAEELETVVLKVPQEEWETWWKKPA